MNSFNESDLFVKIIVGSRNFLSSHFYGSCPQYFKIHFDIFSDNEISSYTLDIMLA